MIEFRPCQPEHVAYIVAQDVQTGELPGLLATLRVQEFQGSVGLSAWADARCVAAAGLIDVWPGRAFAWAMLSKYAYQHLLAITRQMRMVMDNYPAKRIEMICMRDFEPGNRWARMLGFTLETPAGMDKYFADGTSAMLYARVKT